MTENEVPPRAGRASMALGALAMLGGTFGSGYYAGDGYIGRVPGPAEAPRPALQPSNPVQERKRKWTEKRRRAVSHTYRTQEETR